MNLDFSVAAPGGVAAGHPAALAARGADPSLAVPGGNHFFRRIADLTLAPIPGALVPAPTLVPQSIVDLVLEDLEMGICVCVCGSAWAPRVCRSFRPIKVHRAALAR